VASLWVNMSFSSVVMVVMHSFTKNVTEQQNMSEYYMLVICKIHWEVAYWCIYACCDCSVPSSNKYAALSMLETKMKFVIILMMNWLSRYEQKSVINTIVLWHKLCCPNSTSRKHWKSWTVRHYVYGHLSTFVCLSVSVLALFYIF
jgi:hypothetical protein